MSEKHHYKGLTDAEATASRAAHGVNILTSTVVALLGVCMLPVSCSDTDRLEDSPCATAQTGRVHVVFDWQDVPGASPQGMRTRFFDIGAPESDPLTFDHPGRDGGTVRLAAGTYDIVAYNNDTDWVDFKGGRRSDDMDVTVPGMSVADPMHLPGRAPVPQTRAAEGEPVRHTPDHMWTAVLKGVSTQGGAAGDETFTLRPQPLVCDYTYRITGVANLERVATMSATLSGMADGVNLASGVTAGTSCTHAFEAHADADGSITGSFTVFGTVPGDTLRHIMALYVVTRDGGKYRFTGGAGSPWDVTSQIGAAPDRHNVHLTVNVDAAVPSDKAEEGFDPGADDWEDVRILIPV